MKAQQEKLLPAILSNKGPKRPKIITPPEFTGAINVNSLTNTQKSAFDVRLEEYEEPKDDYKNKKIYSNIKEERYFRLNRDNKLKINEEISKYLKSQQQNGFVKKIHLNETDQIKDAAKQLEEINYILEHNKRNPPKKCEQNPNFEGLSFLQKQKSKSKVPSQSNVKHLCTKGLKNNMARNSKLFSGPDMENDKNYFSTPNVLNATDLLKKITNQRNKKAIRNAIETLNSRLQSSKEKILQDYEEAMKKSKKLSPDFVRRGPKYKSLKDIKLDQYKIEEFENEIKTKKKLAEDPKEMKIIFKNNVFNSQESEVQISKGAVPDKKKYLLQNSKELNDLKIIPNNKFEGDTIKNKAPTLPSPRNIEGIDFEKIKHLEKICQKGLIEKPKMIVSPRTPRPIKKILKSPRSPKSPKSPKTNETSTVAVGNEEDNALEKSIMNSSYLSKEFHLGDNFGNPKSDNVVNWADKFKISHANTKKWSKEFEYFLS